MAALVLSVAGGAIGSAFGPLGAIAGRLVGALAGNIIDRSLFGPGNQTAEGPRLGDLAVMASTEGAPIPRVYGRARLGGQVIWATALEEVASESTSPTSGGKGGALSGPTTTTTSYTYFANFAVGLCEGRIGRVGRIWADGKPLDLTGLTLRVHTGGEEQLPDDLIVAREGAGNAPAYRGLAYVVFERLPLADFGNRIPQLTFEITRPVGQLETMVRAVTLIPGTTEFGYEPATVLASIGPGQSQPENRHVAHAPSDVIAALDDLQAVCPNLERVAIVVAWFGSDLRCGQCTVRPGIDNAEKVTTLASQWSVDGVTRGTAYLVSQSSGRPAFGGTPADPSVVHLISELKARGLKITLYPFVVMDISADNALHDPWTGAASQPAYPWRGRITCDPAPGRPGSPQGTSAAADQVANFFAGGSWNYRRMILHYASLAASAGGVDGFLIGSELKALTRVRSGAGVYPAVSALVTLAADVKAIVGPGCLVTYGADWTEYGADVVSASEVRFPLDPLWASPDIGAVGIDYYAPLADWRDDAGHLDAETARSIYDRDYLAANLRAGEAFDWYYPDDAARAAQARSPITDGLGKPWVYRVKDIWNWWSQPHYERVGGAELAAPTAWSPRSKPIWLTEAGCPAVDKGANQPSVFPDPKSSENFTPYFSNGGRDDLIQRRALEAVIGRFDTAFGAGPTDNPVSPVYGGRMLDVSALHLWTWDARPFPVFPGALDVWSDGANWQDGAWAFLVPNAGWCVWSVADAVMFVYDGAVWRDQRNLAVDNLAHLGVNTSATAPNLLSVKSNAALVAAINTADGGSGDVRLQLSKESAGKTASVVFSDAYSGRAEFGLTADDDFHLKVSPNGATWFDALRIDGASGRVSFPVSGGPRETLAANRTYYVRTDGNNANTGLTNTSSGAFLTLQKAIDTAASLDIGIYAVTIQLADGSYAGAIVLKNVAGFSAPGNCIIQGNAATPANVVIAATSSDAIGANGLSTVWDIRDLKVTTTTAGHGIASRGGATVRFGNVNFGACAGAHLFVDGGASLVCLSSYAISGGAAYHWQAVNGGSILASSGFTVTLSGTPAFSSTFAYVGLLALVNCWGNTFSGSATGVRYNVFANSAIFTNSAGASYLPGNAAGTSASGGQYV